jgi:gliding motility-associated-like protein
MRISITRQVLSILLLLLTTQNLLAQYTVNGNAAQNACNEYMLTDDINTQSGSVWNNIKINLTQSFDFKFDVFLGSPQPNGTGADGIAFVVQALSTSVGTNGSGMGYAGISPAVGVTIDTYLNVADGDPASDHVAIQLNGDINHNSPNNIAGPVSALVTNPDIEDALWHSLRIVWDAPTTTLSVYIDGSLRVSAVKDFVTDVFAGNPLVFWGFTGSTGGENNYQAFKTALNPAFNFNNSQKRCVNEPISFNNTTVSFTNIAKFYWDFGDGSPLDSVNLNPVHTYSTHGDFTVILKVIGADGCIAIKPIGIRIGTKPVAVIKQFTGFNICPGVQNQFFDSSYLVFGNINKYYWNLDDGITSVLQNPTVTYTTPGFKTIKLAVSSIEGCESDTALTTIIKRKAIADFDFTDSVCLGQTTFFYDRSVVLPDGLFEGWSWRIDNNIINTQNTSYVFSTPGIQPVMLIVSPLGVGALNCFNLIMKNVFVVDKPHAAIKKNTICPAVPGILQDSSYTTDGLAINSYWWDLGNGQFSTQQNPTVSYNTSGPITIRHVVTNAKGCISDTLTQIINISAKPVANFGYSTPLCDGLPVQFSDSSKVAGADVVSGWSWLYNTNQWSTAQQPTKLFTTGTQTVELIATSSAGCVSNPVNKTFYINPTPDVTINFKDACKNALVNFTATDNSGTVTQWNWAFGDGGVAGTQNAQHAYTTNGTYNVKLLASAANGCYSGSLTGNINIYSTNVFAGNDTIAAAGQPVQLNATGGLSYSWSPAFDLNNPNIANPVTILNATQTFTVKAFTPEGCESFDDIIVKIYKGPDIYLPNAFTPNADTRNDVLKGTLVGIKQFNYLKIYNRWGQMIFYTTDYNYGWDGTWKGQKQNEGNYIAMVSAVDFKGNKIEKQQSIMLIR